MSTRPKPIEFLVIGGGPAGSAAAMALAERGREVLVVERSDYQSPRIGETLPAHAKPVLSRLGLMSDPAVFGHLPCPGVVSVWGGDVPYMNDAVFDPNGDGLHLDRASFDGALAHRAAAAGATYLTGLEVRCCRRDRLGWEITLDDGNAERQLQAATLIDATGRRHWRGRPSRRRFFDRQVAIVTFFSLAEGSSAQGDHRTWIEAAPEGWWYSSVLPGDRLVAAFFTDSDLLDAPRSSRGERWIALLGDAPWTSDRLRSARPLSAPHVVPASSTLSQPIATPAYVAVGDAASTVDALSSHGIVYALTSGLAAAEALLAPRPAPALARYARATSRRFRDDLHTRRQFCRAERRWPNSVFWRRRSGF